MIRLAYFQQNAVVGAAEEYLYTIMLGVDKAIYDVTFICPQDSIMDSLVARVARAGIRVRRYAGASVPTTMWQAWNLFARELRPDVVHFNDPCAVGILAARLAQIPAKVMTYHTPEHNRVYNWKGNSLETLAFMSPPYVIFLNEYDRATGITKHGWLPERSSVVCLGIAPSAWTMTGKDLSVLEELGLDSHAYIIGNVARLSHQKGLEYLIAAAPRIKHLLPNAKFVLVGDGELRTELQHSVDTLGLSQDFVFAGHRQDVRRWLSVFDLFVLPSLYEGLPYAVLEASAMGLPVVASAVGGVRHQVLNGITGILTPPADVNSLKDAILSVATDPALAAALGKAGRERFLSNFTADRMVAETQNVYQRLVSEQDERHR